MAQSRRWRAVAAAIGAVALAAFVSAARPQQAQVCPSQPVPTITPQAPTDVCIPDGFTDVPMDYFDDYSWRVFVALVWPADPAHRGAPATAKHVSDRGPRVFETYKATWEIFHADGTAPKVSSDDYDAAVHNACGVSPKFGDLVIGSASGIDDIGQAGIGMLDPPLAAQNGRYVRTLTLFNPLEFDHIVARQYFLRQQLPTVPTPRPERPVIDFPMGSIAVKTAWVDVTGLPPALIKRFYTRRAIVKRATGGGCSELTMGLVGLHIAQKTPSRPQWIWSSFEQEDNVPPARPNAPGLFTFNDGTRGQMIDTNPLSLVPLAPEPVKPFNVVRAESAPVLTATELTNYSYQRLLAGTPWQYYKLVVTQWPRLNGNQAVPVPVTQEGSVPNTFPGLSAASAFANVTMETFDQKGVQLGCMSCHNRARMTTDFMWTLLDHAYPPRLAAAPAAVRTAAR
jgi:hypothetical protein